MEQKLETKLEIKDKLNNFYNIHKGKIFIFILVLLITSITAVFIDQKIKNNNLIAEKNMYKLI